MKYKEAVEYAAKLRELADFIETNGVKLPSVSITTTATCWLTSTDYRKNDEGEWETIINEDETKQNIKKFLDAVGTCKKDYNDDKIVIEKEYRSPSNHTYGRTMIKGTVDRSVACRKVKTGVKLQPASFVQAKIVDEYEWVCDEGISLLKLVS